MGRPARPLSVLELEGTRGVARLASKAKSTARGKPTMPRGMDSAARAMWRLILSHRGEWIGESDGPALQMLSEAWSLRLRARDALAADACDKLARTAFVSYATLFERLASKFGLTPSDRAKLGEWSADEFDPAAEFIA